MEEEKVYAVTDKPESISKLIEAVVAKREFNDMIQKQIISDYFSNLARLSHQKHPRSKEFYSAIGKIGKRKPKNNQCRDI